MSHVPPPKPPTDNTGAVVATAAGGGILLIILAVIGVLVLMGICVIGVVVFGLFRVRDAAQNAQSMNNVKQIAMAMHVYEQTHQRLPPQFSVDAQQQPLHSWRTLILPYLEQQSLYDQINQDEPWNSPSNAAITQRPMKIYSSPRAGAARSKTSYVVVAGEGFMFNQGQQVRLGDLRDGHSSTIMILEIANSDIDWAQPRDVTLDELQFESEGAPDDAPNLVRESAAVGFADGSVMRLPKGFTREDLRQRLTIAGSEPVAGW